MMGVVLSEYPSGVGCVYVLRLENDKWYVGYTEDLPQRLAKHFNTGGSCWTRLHKPVEVYAVVKASKAYEAVVTLDFMKQLRWQNVRGANWTATVLRTPPVPIKDWLKGQA